MNEKHPILWTKDTKKLYVLSFTVTPHCKERLNSVGI